MNFIANNKLYCQWFVALLCYSKVRCSSLLLPNVKVLDVHHRTESCNHVFFSVFFLMKLLLGKINAH